MNTFRMIRSGTKAYSAVMKISKEENSSSTSEGESSSSKMEEKMGKIAIEQTSLLAETLWNANVFDIESTLRKTCWKVLHDRSCTKQALALRSQSLKLVGAIFEKMVDLKFTKPNVMDMYAMVPNPKSALEYLLSYIPRD